MQYPRQRSFEFSGDPLPPEEPGSASLSWSELGGFACQIFNRAMHLIVRRGSKVGTEILQTGSTPPEISPEDHA